MSLRPQDVVVLLKAFLWSEKHWKSLDLANELELSPSEVSYSLNRLVESGLMDSDKKQVNRSALLEFVLHGLKYVYPAAAGAMSRGVPTAHSAEPLSKKIIQDEHDHYVWPHVDGKMKGQSIEPLYPKAPHAALKDPKLHQLLALIDALRAGRARERKLAAEAFEQQVRKIK